MAPGPDGAPELGIERFNGIGCVDDPADIIGERKERDDFAPRPPPALPDGGITLTPGASLERRQRFFRGVGINGTVNRLKGGSEVFAVFPAHKRHAVAQEMDDTRLNDRLGEHSGDRVGKALKAVDDGKQDIVDAAVLQLVQSGSPRSMLRGVA